MLESAAMIAKREGKKVQVRIGDIREIERIQIEISAEQIVREVKPVLERQLDKAHALAQKLAKRQKKQKAGAKMHKKAKSAVKRAMKKLGITNPDTPRNRKRIKAALSKSKG